MSKVIRDGSDRSTRSSSRLLLKPLAVAHPSPSPPPLSPICTNSRIGKNRSGGRCPVVASAAKGGGVGVGVEGGGGGQILVDGQENERPPGIANAKVISSSQSSKAFKDHHAPALSQDSSLSTTTSNNKKKETPQSPHVKVWTNATFNTESVEMTWGDTEEDDDCDENSSDGSTSACSSMPLRIPSDTLTPLLPQDDHLSNNNNSNDDDDDDNDNNNNNHGWAKKLLLSSELRERIPSDSIVNSAAIIPPPFPLLPPAVQSSARRTSLGQIQSRPKQLPSPVLRSSMNITSSNSSRLGMMMNRAVPTPEGQSAKGEIEEEIKQLSRRLAELQLQHAAIQKKEEEEQQKHRLKLIEARASSSIPRPRQVPNVVNPRKNNNPSKERQPQVRKREGVAGVGVKTGVVAISRSCPQTPAAGSTKSVRGVGVGVVGERKPTLTSPRSLRVDQRRVEEQNQLRNKGRVVAAKFLQGQKQDTATTATTIATAAATTSGRITPAKNPAPPAVKKDSSTSPLSKRRRCASLGLMKPTEIASLKGVNSNNNNNSIITKRPAFSCSSSSSRRVVGSEAMDKFGRRLSLNNNNSTVPSLSTWAESRANRRSESAKPERGRRNENSKAEQVAIVSISNSNNHNHNNKYGFVKGPSSIKKLAFSGEDNTIVIATDLPPSSCLVVGSPNLGNGARKLTLRSGYPAKTGIGKKEEVEEGEKEEKEEDESVLGVLTPPCSSGGPRNRFRSPHHRAGLKFLQSSFDALVREYDDTCRQSFQLRGSMSSSSFSSLLQNRNNSNNNGNSSYGQNLDDDEFEKERENLPKIKTARIAIAVEVSPNRDSGCVKRMIDSAGKHSIFSHHDDSQESALSISHLPTLPEF